jgi:hypothetical protein
LQSYSVEPPATEVALFLKDCEARFDHIDNCTGLPWVVGGETGVTSMEVWDAAGVGATFDGIGQQEVEESILEVVAGHSLA